MVDDAKGNHTEREEEKEHKGEYKAEDNFDTTHEVVLEDGKEEVEKEDRGVDDEVAKKYEEEKNKLMMDLESAQRSAEEVASEVENLKKEKESLSKLIENLQEELERMNKMYEDLEETSHSTTTKLEDANKQQLEQFQTILQNFNTQKEGMWTTNEEQKHQLEALRTQLAEEATNKKRWEAERLAMLKNFEEEKTMLSQQLQKVIRQLDEEMENMKAKFEGQKKKLLDEQEVLVQQLQDSSTQLQLTRAEIAQLHAQKLDLQQKVTEMEAKLNSISSMSGTTSNEEEHSVDGEAGDKPEFMKLKNEIEEKDAEIFQMKRELLQKEQSILEVSANELHMEGK